MDFKTINEIIEYRAEENPDKIAYTFLLDGEDQEDNITYLQLLQRVKSIAYELQNKYQKGDRALLLFEPSLDFIVSFYACLFAGIIAVPAYPPDVNRLNKSVPRLLSIIKDSETSVILTTSNIMGLAKGFTSSIPELKNVGWLSVDNLDINNHLYYKKVEILPETIAFLQYTSGSTASPKGVILDHECLIYNEEMINQCFYHFDKSQPTTFVGWLPLYHDMGLIGNVIQPLYINSQCILMSPIKFLKRPFRWLKAISKYKAYTSGAPNFAYELCVHKITEAEKSTLDLSSWRVAYNGAEPIKARTLDRFYECFKEYGLKKEVLFPVYGLAEATLIVSGGSREEEPIIAKVKKSELEKHNIIFTQEESDSIVLVSSGRSILEQEIKIVNSETFEELESNEVGEIWVNGKNIAKGYWNKPEKTKETFKAQIKGQEGIFYLRTGDLGFLSNNELYVTGRIKDMLIISGRNIYPYDIERVIESKRVIFPEIRLGCIACFGIEANNKENIGIMMEISPSKNPSFDIDKLQEAIIATVFNEFELPIYSITFIKEGNLPKTSSGKIQRYLCKKAFNSNIINEVIKNYVAYDIKEIILNKNDNLISDFIIEWIKKEFIISNEKIDINLSFNFYGFDSINSMRFINDLENYLNKNFDSNLLLDFPNIKTLSEYLSSQEKSNIQENKIIEFTENNNKNLDLNQKEYSISDKDSLSFNLSENGFIDSDKYSLYDLLVDSRIDSLSFTDRLDVICNWSSDMHKKEHYLYRRTVLEGSKPFIKINDKFTGKIKEMINLSSNDYLNLTKHPRILKAGISCFENLGAGAGSVPMLGGTHQINRKLEQKIAAVKGCESALVYTSGYGANIGVLTALLRKNDVAIIDSLAHASLIDGTNNCNKLFFKHNDLDSLESILISSKNKYKNKLVILDGVYSMDGDIANLDKILELAHSFGAWVLVDEAHATGVIGKNGGGTPEHFNLKGKIDIVTGTLSKAMGCVGGFVAGKMELIKYLEASSRPYIFSTAPFIPVSACALESLYVIEEEAELRIKLWRNINYFASNLRKLGFDLGNSETAILPLIIGNDYKVKEMATQLHRVGVMVNSVLYPAVPKHLSRIRMSVTTGLNQEYLDKALNEIEFIGKKLNLI
jgi:8-amino-7-oxononanoate synthase